MTLSRRSDHTGDLLAHLLLFARGAATPSSNNQGGSTMQDVDRIAGQALQALGDHMDDIDKYAPAAARRYVQALLDGKPGTPHTSTLHPCADRLLRECVLDVMALDRRSAA